MFFFKPQFGNSSLARVKVRTYNADDGANLIYASSLRTLNKDEWLLFEVVGVPVTYLSLFTEANPVKHMGNRKDNPDNLHGTMLSEDYAEIVDDEGDYSTPSSECSCYCTLYYWLDIFPARN